jgi:hypothetical protein
VDDRPAPRTGARIGDVSPDFDRALGVMQHRRVGREVREAAGDFGGTRRRAALDGNAVDRIETRLKCWAAAASVPGSASITVGLCSAAVAQH